MVVFTRWVTALMLRRGKYGAAIKILGAVAQRKLRLCDHPSMKQRILSAASPCLSPTDINGFINQKLLPKVNPRVTELINSLRADHTITILATAAPELYANKLGSHLGFNAIIATPAAAGLSDDCAKLENKGETKLRNVKKLLRELNASLSTVITDHSDDLPLIRANISGTNYLVDSCNGSINIKR